MNAVDLRAHTWRVLLSLPGRVGMVAPVTADDIQRMSAVTFGAAAASRRQGAPALAAGVAVGS